MEKENLIFSSKILKLEILIETCLFSEHHYGHFWTHLSIYVSYYVCIIQPIPTTLVYSKQPWSKLDIPTYYILKNNSNYMQTSMFN